jgi:thioredoxin-related protein
MRSCLQWRRIGVIWAALMLAPTLLTGTASASEIVSMQQVSDLRQEAQSMRAGKLVMVLEFAREDCPYCHKLERLFLLPMQRNADYDDKILVRSISLDDDQTVIDFDGRSVATNEFAARYGVSLTPTLLFLNADGSEISERLVGIWSEDFYGGFIDSRIETARDSL